jgi:hypothetical protein
LRDENASKRNGVGHWKSNCTKPEQLTGNGVARPNKIAAELTLGKNNVIFQIAKFIAILEDEAN